MKKFLQLIEPLIWGPFVTGNFLTPLIFPALILMIGIAVPLGWVSADAVSYERMLGLAKNPIAVLGMIVVLSLSFLSGAHHLRFLFIDFRGVERDVVMAPLLYGIAGLGGLFTLLAVVRILFA